MEGNNKDQNVNKWTRDEKNSKNDQWYWVGFSKR